LVQLGLLYYNSENPDSAMMYFKRVVEGFPNSPEAKNALMGIRNIYVDRGDANTYFNYASSLGSLANMSLAEKDSLTYISAEKIYITGDCEKSNAAFSSYLRDFPQGNFCINALFYQGECYRKQGMRDRAIEAFDDVATRQKNDFTGQSLLRLGELYFEKGSYDKSYEAYAKLESVAEYKSMLQDARIGMLRCAFEQKQYADIPAIASSILSAEKLPDELERETQFKLAKSLYELGRTDEALVEYSKVATNLKTAEGAEAKYMKTSIYFQKKDYKKTEAEVFDFAEKNTPHQYWLAKSFILLAEVYANQDDFFQAKATLNSVIDGYSSTTDGIIDEATAKLNQLVKTEKDKQSVKVDEGVTF